MAFILGHAGTLLAVPLVTLREGARIGGRKSSQMSQRAVEAVLGRLICDDSFRREFCNDPNAAVAQWGYRLTPVEVVSLQSLRLRAVEAFAEKLDERIRQAHGPLPE